MNDLAKAITALEQIGTAYHKQFIRRMEQIEEDAILERSPAFVRLREEEALRRGLMEAEQRERDRLELKARLKRRYPKVKWIE